MVGIVDTLKNEGGRRVQRVIGFLVGKGFLWTTFPVDPFFGKVKIKDVLWVAENREPRVLEVFPAAYLHFPKTFIGRSDLPPDLADVISRVEKGDINPRDEYKGIKLTRMAKWNNRPIMDKRTRPSDEKKVNKTFRMRKSLARKIKTVSEQLNMTQVDWLEKLIQDA